MVRQIIYIGLILSGNALSQTATFDYRRSVITDPSISRRCEALLDQRNKKVGVKQRLTALIIRNERLQKIAPLEKIIVRRKLQSNLRHLKHELELTISTIQQQEENIIRRGCPGISL